MDEAERPFRDEESEAVIEAVVAGFSAAFGVAPEVLDTIDVYPAISEIPLVAEALVVEAVE
ncbi:MAG: hypothetical protein GF399_09240 [Candidatus Coatesbacteria bacterium]|nr:hypothetical protein [Candidatus Coatesbacteria bacterium]